MILHFCFMWEPAAARPFFVYVRSAEIAFVMFIYQTDATRRRVGEEQLARSFRSHRQGVQHIFNAAMLLNYHYGFGCKSQSTCVAVNGRPRPGALIPVRFPPSILFRFSPAVTRMSGQRTNRRTAKHGGAIEKCVK